MRYCINIHTHSLIYYSTFTLLYFTWIHCLFLLFIIYICVCKILYFHLFYNCIFTMICVKIYKIQIKTTRKLQFLAILKNSQPTTFKIQIKPFSEGKKKPNPHEV